MEEGEAAGFNDGKNTDMWIVREDTVVPTHLAFVAKSQQKKAGVKCNLIHLD